MNRENLKILSDGLLGLIAPVIPTENIEFDMKNYSKAEANSFPFAGNYEVTCRTAGCAVGWAPFFGIKKEPTEEFSQYGLRVFQVNAHVWMYLFTAQWTRTDNTKEGAGLRIKYVLEHGLPSNWKEQIRGDASLSYKQHYE